MMEVQVTMTELRQKLGSLVNRAAYGHERIVLVAHGQPKAAIISVEELHRLQQLSRDSAPQSGPYTEALAAADRIREAVGQWQAENKIEPGDSVETLNQLRDERDDEILGLR